MDFVRKPQSPSRIFSVPYLQYLHEHIMHTKLPSLLESEGAQLELLVGLILIYRVRLDRVTVTHSTILH